MNSSHLMWFSPIALLFLIAPFTSTIDLALSQMSYLTNSFHSGPLLDFIFKWGLLPGQLLIAFSLIALIVSYLVNKYKRYRMQALYLVATLAIGAGFITHALLKDHWGRPRPRQVIEFGGTEEYRPFWKPNFSKQSKSMKSFPCGHCTMGFAFFSFYFLGKRLKKPWVSILGTFASLLLGIGLGAARILQGGHFFSDIFATALIMWLTALMFDKILFEKKETAQ